jgi:hypothetical protein
MPIQPPKYLASPEKSNEFGKTNFWQLGLAAFVHRDAETPHMKHLVSLAFGIGPLLKHMWLMWDI